MLPKSKQTKTVCANKYTQIDGRQLEIVGMATGPHVKEELLH